ncbi:MULTISPECIES: hypothetical protein [unclassified Methylobacterium]|uniref:hypothetical protein n=1 Tax=unclassified Methylobacterium TaxID=2615210 RepID=UPI000AE4B716|nr:MULTISPECIES: hypothetical protein [unclassified Methylobacterium]MCK2057244.1 hypothetical protein [Methylobacterium sp. 37f]
MSIPDNQKTRGRPATGVTPMQGVRMPSDLLVAVEAWRDDQPEPKPPRAEAIRRILAEHLKAKGYLK